MVTSKNSTSLLVEMLSVGLFAVYVCEFALVLTSWVLSDWLQIVGTRAGFRFNIQWCGFAKKAKDGKRDLSKKGHVAAVKVALSEEELNEVIDYEDMIKQMEAALEHLRKEYAEQLTLRTSVNAFDGLTVDTPDGQFPLIQIAQVIHYWWLIKHHIYSSTVHSA